MQADAITMAKLKDQFVQVPPFQRMYSWQERNWTRIWVELGLAYFDRLTNTDKALRRPIFLGALVRQELGTMSLSDKDCSQYAIIDGQQRLVTLALMAAALRDHALEPGSEAASTLDSDLLFIRDEDEWHPRLAVQEQDAAPFARAIERGVGSSKYPISKDYPSSLVAKAYDHFFELFGQAEDALLESLTYGEATEVDDISEVEREGGTLVEADSTNQSMPPQHEVGTSRIDVRTFRKILYSDVTFVDVTLEINDDHSSEIFESLNDTGMQLSPVDLFRNGYFLLLPAQREKVFKEFWEPMEEAHRALLPPAQRRQQKITTLEGFFFDEAIRRFGWTPRDSTYSKLMSEIRGGALQARLASDPRQADKAYANSVERSLTEIRQLDRLYRVMTREKRTNPDVADILDDLSAPVRGELRFLALWDSAPARPLVLELLRQRLAVTSHALAPSDEDLAEALHMVSTLLVRRCVGGVAPQQLRSLLSSAPNQLRARLEVRGTTLTDAVSTVFEAYGEERLPSKVQLMASWQREVYRITGKKKQLALVLWEIERHQNAENSVNLGELKYGSGKSNYSLEHVMPQGIPRPKNHGSGGRPGADEIEINLPDGWEEDLTSWGVEKPFEFYRRYRHTLANLTLALGGHNSLYSTHRFDQKKAEYQELSKLDITLNQICTKTRWNQESLQERATWLVDEICRIWPLSWD